MNDAQGARYIPRAMRVVKVLALALNKKNSYDKIFICNSV